MPLPTTLPDTALSLKREHEIEDALQTDPERLRTGKAIAFSDEEATKGGGHSHHGIE